MLPPPKLVLSADKGLSRMLVDGKETTVEVDVGFNVVTVGFFVTVNVLIGEYVDPGMGRVAAFVLARSALPS